MAVLSNNDRADCWATFMRERNAERDGLNLSKPELRAAVDALDVYFNDNAAAINTAIPQPARGALTTPQKALLAIAVLRRRYLSGA